MDVNLERAWLLIQTSSYSQAEEELRRQLAADPNNCLAHLLLCQCFIEQKRYIEAIRESDLLICIAPHYAHAYYSKAFVTYNFYLTNPKKVSKKVLLNKAEKAARKAIRFSPDMADYWMLLAAILFEEGYCCKSIISRDIREIFKKEKVYRLYWLDALQAIEESLLIEPDSIESIHLKALIFNKLDRKEQAKITLFRQTLKLSLFEKQQHPATHIYLGWLLLDENNHKQALEHFIFAFKLSQEPEKARLGIVESLKRKYFIYRLLSPTTKIGKSIWLFSIGLFSVVGIARLFDFSRIFFPNWLLSSLVSYILFVSVLPLTFNSVLKFKKYENKFLSTTELVIAHFLAGVILVILATITVLNIYPLGNRGIPLFLTLVSSSLFIPLAVMQAYSFGKPKRMMTKYTLILSIFALVGLILFTKVKCMSGALGLVATLMSILYCSISTVGSFLSYHVATNLLDRPNSLFKKYQQTNQ
jgi:tetratricopeptide (TPR) repeat protein